MGEPGCVRCRSAARPLPRCPFCGTEVAALWGRPAGGASQPSPFAVEEAQLERRLLRIAPPVAVLAALLLMQLDTWRWLARTFLSMWVHELGHTVAAWFSGRFALPGPWVTRIDDARSAVVILLVAAGIGAIGYCGWRARRWWQLGVAMALGVTQLVCTATLDRREADTFITFFGDGGMFVLGAALMLTFWSPPGSYLHKQWLRWGFLVIGAFAFGDALLTWCAAHGDSATIAYGEIEGVGHSDPTKLVFGRNWPEATMIRRYLTLGAVSFAAVAGRYAYAVWRGEPLTTEA